jgi:hypothetical protein
MAGAIQVDERRAKQMQMVIHRSEGLLSLDAFVTLESFWVQGGGSR